MKKKCIVLKISQAKEKICWHAHKFVAITMSPTNKENDNNSEKVRRTRRGHDRSATQMNDKKIAHKKVCNGSQKCQEVKDLQLKTRHFCLALAHFIVNNAFGLLKL